MSVNVIIFGASKKGRFVRYSLPSKYKVIAFCDNDVAKHDKQIDGVKIISPNRLNDYHFDLILIGSMYEAEIYDQLMKLGIEKGKIINGFNASVSTVSFPWDAVFFIFFIVSSLFIVLMTLFF